MKTASYLSRVGGFVSINTGSIRDCYTDAKVKYENNAAGFVFENTGGIARSVSKGQTSGRENIAGFCCRNKGTIANAGWLCSAETSGKTSYLDAALEIAYEKAEALKDKLGLGAAWRALDGEGERLELDEQVNTYLFDAEGTSVIGIGSAEELERLALDIAAGDEAAASAHYRLVCDINLHGKKWLPLGLSDAAPFTGIFDGGGHKITNFKIRSKKLEYAGFFGCIKGGVVANLSLDCIADARGGHVTGCLCGINDKGMIVNCRVVARVSAEKICGGFVGKNMGVIEKCCFIGKIVPAAPLVLIFLPFCALLVLLLAVGAGIMLNRLLSPPWSPEIIDPNARPSTATGTYTPPPAGSNRISFELNQEVYISSVTQVGIVNYVNPKRSTQDVVIRVLISDAELMRTIGKTGRSASEQAALEAEQGYDAETSYQELYRSGRIKIGYEIEAIKLSALADGTLLPVGDYEMLVAIDAYDPDTNEKSVVNAQAPITVHVVDPEG